MVITTQFVSCTTSTIGDSCYDSCCAKQSGGSAELLRCVVADRCKENTTITTTYKSCSTDDDGNICNDKCCGYYQNFNVTSCENGAMCNGVYTPAILAKATAQDMEGASKESIGGVSASTAIAIGIITGVGVIGIIIAVLLFVKYRKVKKERLYLKKIEEASA